MTFVGVAGLLLGFAAFYVADLRGQRIRFAVFVLLFVMHALMSSGYYLIIQATGSDANLYYYDTLRLHGSVTGLSTVFVVNFVQTLKEYFGGTFFDYFMIFQSMGFWGIIYIFKVITEIVQELEIEQPVITFLPLFLPGVHYWTGAIGKDAPLFLGVALAIWSCMRLNKRLVGMGIATVIMLAVRPHIAMVSLISLGLASLVDSRIKLWMKALLLVGIAIGGSVVASSLDTTYSLNISSAESVSEFMANHSSIGEDSGADMNIVQGAIVFKVFTFWLRPFFLDAENMMGYVASLENAAILMMFGFAALNFRLVRTLTRQVLFVRYSIIFFILLTALLAPVNYNVGLGLRQKMMAMPCLIIIFAALMAVKAARSSASRAIEANSYRPAAAMASASPRADLAR